MDTARQHNGWFTLWGNIIRRQCVAVDMFVRFRVKLAVEQGYAGASRITLVEVFAEPDRNIGATVPLRVLKGHQEATLVRPLVTVVHAASGIHVNHAVRSYDKVSRMTYLVGENLRGEAWWKRYPTLVVSARMGSIPHRQTSCHSDQGDGNDTGTLV